MERILTLHPTISSGYIRFSPRHHLEASTSLVSKASQLQRIAQAYLLLLVPLHFDTFASHVCLSWALPHPFSGITR